MTLKDDYLKYWRVIRRFIKVKYNLSESDLDILLFLNSEGKFTRSKFKEFDRILSWDRKRFERLMNEGWIDVFRKRDGNLAGLYELSYKAKRVITSIYKKLSGEEIPTSPTTNPIFLRNVSYTDNRYKKAITEMNAFIKQQQQRAHE